MKWMVTLQTEGGQRIVEVFARTKADAEYRAAFKVEAEGERVVRTIRALKRAG